MCTALMAFSFLQLSLKSGPADPPKPQIRFIVRLGLRDHLGQATGPPRSGAGAGVGMLRGAGADTRRGPNVLL